MSASRRGAALAGKGVNRDRPRILTWLRGCGHAYRHADHYPERPHRESLPQWLPPFTGVHYSRGFGGITGDHGNVPFFLIGRRKTLSPEVTYSVCSSGPPNTTLDGSLLSGLSEAADIGTCDLSRSGEPRAGAPPGERCPPPA